mmetsp:Transcript_13873/g.38368  ORF Transcript_13873/g.38368 Transcript_13873/m.38368 type:complete len:362 (-) Transcript_13873:3308-4393(-)
MRSITSTTPTTVPSSSQTGSVRKPLSCIKWRASITDKSGVTVSGLGVMTSLTGVSSSGSPRAIARVIISLKPKTPTSSPASSTTRAAFRCSAIRSPASRIVVEVLTIVGAPMVKRLLIVVVAVPSASKFPSSAFIASACSPLCVPTTELIVLSIAMLFSSSAFSRRVMALLRHLETSKTPVIAPESSTTGKYRMRFSTIVVRESSAESAAFTQIGLGVITSPISTLDGSRRFATTRHVISLSDTMPARPPSGPTIIAAGALLLRNSCVTVVIESVVEEMMGLLGRNLLTGRSSISSFSETAASPSESDNGAPAVFCFRALELFADLADFLEPLSTELTSDTSSSMSIEPKSDRQPSAPPHP